MSVITVKEAKWRRDSRFGWKVLAALGVVSLMILAVLANAQTIPRASASPPSPPNLGTAIGFGVLAGSAITNTGASVVFGNLGVSPGTAVTGFPPGTVSGAIHKSDGVALQAKSDLASAYNAISSDSCSTNLTGQNLGGLTLTPGVYCFSSAALLTGTLTLDSQGDNSALFIFKIGSALTTASSSSVLVTASGDFCNVFWQVGSSAVLGTNTVFAGNILALASITLATGASIAGGALARNGAVTLDTNHVGACPTQSAWTQQMHHTPTPGEGCFHTPYPNTVWQRVPCGTGVPSPAIVGGGGAGSDWSANAGSTHIGYALGDFSTVTDVTSEFDSIRSTDFYSLQLNSNTFLCTPQGGSPNSNCWEQFIFDNNGICCSKGVVQIQYWLLGYYTNNGNSCPSVAPPSTWFLFTHTNGVTDCWGASGLNNNVPNEDPTTQLGKLSFSGTSNISSSGTDVVNICDGSGCWSESNTDFFSLDSHWGTTEFNVFGYSDSSQANFNTGISLTAEIFEEDGSGLIITSTCLSTGFTGETSNLSLGSCSPVGGPLAHISFTESH